MLKKCLIEHFGFSQSNVYSIGILFYIPHKTVWCRTNTWIKELWYFDAICQKTTWLKMEAVALENFSAKKMTSDERREQQALSKFYNIAWMTPADT